MVGGTVADLFHAKQRGIAMNVFACLNFIGGVSLVSSNHRGLHSALTFEGSGERSDRMGGYEGWCTMVIWRESDLPLLGHVPD